MHKNKDLVELTLLERLNTVNKINEPGEHDLNLNIGNVV